MYRVVRAVLAASALVVALVAIPVAGGTETAPVPGAEPFEGGWAVPVSTQAPSWATPELAEQILANGDNGTPLPAGVEVPTVAGVAVPGIHPGIWLLTILSKKYIFAWCTANYIFQKNGTYAIGTAGHCAPDLGSIVTAVVVPPPTSGKLPGIYPIGKFGTVHNNGIGDDFALVNIYSQYNSWVNPTMPVWGGPTGVYNGTLPTQVDWVGHAAAIGTGGTPRTGTAPIWNARNGNAYAFYGPSFEGDSGSAVNAALDPTVPGAVQVAGGDLTHIVIYDGTNKDPVGQILPGMIAGTTMRKILSIASGWTLVKGSLVGA